MKAVVTGASGHVGGNLVRALLDRGWAVRAVVREDVRAVADLPVERVRADVLDGASLRAAFAGVDLVFHLAARISVAGSEKGLVPRVNVAGVRNVVEACLACGVPRLIHFSSIHAFAVEPRAETTDETRGAPGPGAPAYDRSKAAGEREVLVGVERGLDAVIINPTAVVGPHDYKPSAMGQVILQICRQQLPWLVRGGFNWVDVRDVVTGALSAAERGRRGERYLLSGEWRSLEAFARLVSEVAGVPHPRFILPLWLGRVGAPLALIWDRLRGRRPLVTRESLEALRSHRFISHAKAAHELEYRPRPLAVTIRETVDWFRSARMWFGRPHERT